MADEPLALDSHPIQLSYLGVKELYLRSRVSPTNSIEITSSDYDLFVAHSGYDRELKRIRVGVKVEMGMRNREGGSGPTLPYELRVELFGDFVVDDARFVADSVEDWAERGAIYILYPYVREHVFSLTARAGCKPALLDLIGLPVGATMERESPSVP